MPSFRAILTHNQRIQELSNFASGDSWILSSGLSQRLLLIAKTRSGILIDLLDDFSSCCCHVLFTVVRYECRDQVKMERVILMIVSFLREDVQSAGANETLLEAVMCDIVQLGRCSAGLRHCLGGLREEVMGELRFWHNLGMSCIVDLYCGMLIERKCLRGELICPVTEAEYNAAQVSSRAMCFLPSSSPAEQRRMAREAVDRLELVLFHEQERFEDR